MSSFFRMPIFRPVRFEPLDSPFEPSRDSHKHRHCEYDLVARVEEQALRYVTGQRLYIRSAYSRIDRRSHKYWQRGETVEDDHPQPEAKRRKADDSPGGRSRSNEGLSVRLLEGEDHHYTHAERRLDKYRCRAPRTPEAPTGRESSVPSTAPAPSVLHRQRGKECQPSADGTVPQPKLHAGDAITTRGASYGHLIGEPDKMRKKKTTPICLPTPATTESDDNLARRQPQHETCLEPRPIVEKHLAGIESKQVSVNLENVAAQGTEDIVSTALVRGGVESPPQSRHVGFTPVNLGAFPKPNSPTLRQRSPPGTIAQLSVNHAKYSATGSEISSLTEEERSRLIEHAITAGSQPLCKRCGKPPVGNLCKGPTGPKTICRKCVYQLNTARKEVDTGVAIAANIAETKAAGNRIAAFPCVASRTKTRFGSKSSLRLGNKARSKSRVDSLEDPVTAIVPTQNVQSKTINRMFKGSPINELRRQNSQLFDLLQGDMPGFLQSHRQSSVLGQTSQSTLPAPQLGSRASVIQSSEPSNPADHRAASKRKRRLVTFGTPIMVQASASVQTAARAEQLSGRPVAVHGNQRERATMTAAVLTGDCERDQSVPVSLTNVAYAVVQPLDTSNKEFVKPLLPSRPIDPGGPNSMASSARFIRSETPLKEYLALLEQNSNTLISSSDLKRLKRTARRSINLCEGTASLEPRPGCSGGDSVQLSQQAGTQSPSTQVAMTRAYEAFQSGLISPEKQAVYVSPITSSQMPRATAAVDPLKPAVTPQLSNRLQPRSASNTHPSQHFTTVTLTAPVLMSTQALFNRYQNSFPSTPATPSQYQSPNHTAFETPTSSANQLASTSGLSAFGTPGSSAHNGTALKSILKNRDANTPRRHCGIGMFSTNKVPVMNLESVRTGLSNVTNANEIGTPKPKRSDVGSSAVSTGTFWQEAQLSQDVEVDVDVDMDMYLVEMDETLGS